MYDGITRREYLDEELLLDNGADFKVENSDRHTPLEAVYALASQALDNTLRLRLTRRENTSSFLSYHEANRCPSYFIIVTGWSKIMVDCNVHQ